MWYHERLELKWLLICWRHRADFLGKYLGLLLKWDSDNYDRVCQMFWNARRKAADLEDMLREHPDTHFPFIPGFDCYNPTGET